MSNETDKLLSGKLPGAERVDRHLFGKMTLAPMNSHDTDVSLTTHEMESLILGAVSIEQTDRGIVPWRLDHCRRAFLQEPLERKATAAAGVHLRFTTDASTLRLEFDHSSLLGEIETGVWDVYVDGRLFMREAFPTGEARVLDVFDLPGTRNDIMIYLPTDKRVCLRQLDANAPLTPPIARLRWVTHGSSITHSVLAAGPGETWPAIVARAMDWEGWNMGFAGQCKIETVVARQIARQPADLISLCLGINVASQDYSLRTWIPAVEGFIMTIRDGHPNTPLLVISPILSPPKEHWDEPPCKIGLETMRQLLTEIVGKFRADGDTNIHYLDGTAIIGPGDEHTMPDNLHPDAEGIKLMGQRFLQHMPPGWIGNAPGRLKGTQSGF